MHERAGTIAQKSDLIDVDALISAYYDLEPDPSEPTQRVVFGTSGHRGSSFDAAFNEAHIVATTQAIIEYRASQGIDGPIYLARDTHGLSEPAWRTTIEVLTAADIDLFIDERGTYTPTPALSLAVLNANGAPHSLRTSGPGLSDGIVITPSHNPPRDGGFKYNPPSGGPAGSSATNWIAQRANEILETGWRSIPRTLTSSLLKHPRVHPFDYVRNYIDQLTSIIDIDAIHSAGIRIGADPLGGASIDYWAQIGETFSLDLTVVNHTVDPSWYFMTLDWDGKIRMDCSSPYAMASLLENMKPNEWGKTPYDIATGNDADSDRHGIVTPDGLMNPNHFLAVTIDYLIAHRPDWPTQAKIGKTLVSSELIDRVVARAGRKLLEVPVGFKHFVPGLLTGDVCFGGEESAGASFLRKDGSVWTTDKDGIILALLASEILAKTGETPSQIHKKLTEELGVSAYARIDAPATKEEKAKLASLDPGAVTATELAGDAITAKLVRAPGNNEPFGGLKVCTDSAWFAARPSGTEDVYKIYAESFKGAGHLELVQDAARTVVSDALE